MIKKNYTSPVLEVIEIGLSLMQEASPYAITPPIGITKHDDWATDNKENDYDI